MKKLTGIDIYKLLPKTNCGDCHFPTCMAFAMQVAAKKVALEQCPHVSAEAKAALGEAQAPPMRTIRIGAGEREFVVGGETVLFRHDEKFYHPTGIAIRVPDNLGDEELAARVEKIDKLRFIRVGQEIGVDLVAVEHRAGAGDGSRYADVVERVKGRTKLPLVLLCPDPQALAPALESAAAGRPLVWAATPENWEEMSALAAKYKIPLAIRALTLEGLAELVERVKGKGVEDLVLDPGGKDLLDNLTKLVLIRRLALEKTFRPLGYPTLVFAGSSSPAEEAAEATAYICKYGSIVVLDGAESWQLLPLLTVRQNIYTDPQVPNAIEAKLYEVGSPTPESPVLVTTNFALTYFTVEGEVENSKVPAYIAVVNTEGLGVLNAYADDKFTAERIIKAVKEYGVMERVRHKRLVIPGLVAVLRMEIQEETGWEVIVGPEDAAGIPSFLRNEWSPN
ncbi:MAG: acetyl-CoA decarbonylase/synthase complex subunit gamma [Candidatus Bipolaricaulia bacterium]